MAKLIIELDYFDDREEIKILMNAKTMFSVIHDARQAIRNRIKHQEIPQQEAKFLEEIRSTLYIEEIECL